MKIGLTFDLKTNYQLSPDDPPDKYAEFDKDETINVIETAIRSGGYEVVRIGSGKQVLDFFWVNKNRVDLVFNITEGINYRSREAQVPAILDMLDVPYVGSDPLTQTVTLDKIVAKQIVSYHQLNTPQYVQAVRVEDLQNYSLGFPAIVKLRYEGTSKGLDYGAKVNDFTGLRNRVEWAINTYHQPVIIEQFIRGKEFTVGIIGNDNPDVLPPVQIAINGKRDLKDDFYIHPLVEGPGIEYLCPAEVSPEFNQKLIDFSLSAYRALECRDFGRIDLRCDENDIIYFLECNPLPSLALVDIWPIVANRIGITYNQMINRIIDYAILRYPHLQKG